MKAISSTTAPQKQLYNAPYLPRTTYLIEANKKRVLRVSQTDIFRNGAKLTPNSLSLIRSEILKMAETKWDHEFLESTARSFKSAIVASLLSMTCCLSPALADLNVYEASKGGEFGIGTAQQYGEADLSGRDFSGQDLTRSNFTAADCRNCNFKDSILVGAYFIKSVLYRANFENADLSDVLMDRAVLVEANLKNAILERVVLTRSDLNNAIIEGADFSNSLVDRTQQLSLCRYASGENPVTGVATRKSLGCSSRREYRAQTPSNVNASEVTAESKERFTKSLPTFGK